MAYPIASAMHAGYEPCTALLVDLRDFTPCLNASQFNDTGQNSFLEFVSEVYALCLESCRVALIDSEENDTSLQISSTGDGVLATFLGTQHASSAYLATFILHMTLKSKCASYNVRSENLDRPKTSYGIGVESGVVSRLRASLGENSPLSIATCVGPCINLAARAEALTKNYAFARTIFGPHIQSLVCEAITGQNVEDIARRARDPALTDAQRVDLQLALEKLNRELCLSFLHYHNLKGIDEPVALFRIAGGMARPGNPRFDLLLERLIPSDDQRRDVRSFIESRTSLIHRDWAYEFTSPCGIDELARRLNRENLWKWQLRESHWYGDYLRALPSEGTRVRIHSFEQGKYSSQIECHQRVNADAIALDATLIQALQSAGADNIREIETYD